MKEVFLAAREAAPAYEVQKPEEWAECPRFVKALLGGGSVATRSG